MTGEEAAAWVELVAEARRNPDSIAGILEALGPILRRLARNVAGGLADDAVQAASLAIWRALPKVDLSRGPSIRSMLLKTAYHAMRDEVRRDLRQSRRPAALLLEPIVRSPGQAPEFAGILVLYARYVRENGTFTGAHRHVARLLNVSMAKSTSDFHRAARRYIEEEGLQPPRKQYAAVIEQVLQGSAAGEVCSAAG